jgi:hypothetical protein
MGKRRHFAVLLLAPVFGVVLFLATRSSEPVYEGRSLSEWLEELPQGVTFSPCSGGWQPARAIRVRNSGSELRALFVPWARTHVLPRKIGRTPDSAWKTPISWSRRYSRLGLRWQTPFERRSAAFAALSELETAAAPAVIELLSDEELPLNSRRQCLWLVERVGSATRPAVPALLRMIEKSDPMTRCDLLRPLVTAGSIDLPLVVTAAMTNANAVARSNALVTLSKLDEPSEPPRTFWAPC